MDEDYHLFDGREQPEARKHVQVRCGLGMNSMVFRELSEKEKTSGEEIPGVCKICQRREAPSKKPRSFIVMMCGN